MSSGRRRVGPAVSATLAAIVVCIGMASSPTPTDASTGSPQVTPRIIGGSLAPAGSWPSVVELYFTNDGPLYGFECGGTLVGSRWVLTAGHCVTQTFGSVIPSSAIMVLAGTHKLTGSSGKRIVLSRIVRNPNYIDGDQPENDLALLELRSSPSLPVRAVIKPSQSSYWEAGDSAFVAGWGGTVSQPASCGGDPPEPPCPTQYYSTDLRQVEVPVVSDADCLSAYPTIISISTFCAGNSPNPPDNDLGKDACQGDSGGPLEVDTPSGRALIGVVSGGTGCAAPGYAGTYNRTANYRTWIGNYAASLSGKPSPTGFGKVKTGAKRVKSVTLKGTSSLPATVGKYSVTGKGFKKAGGTCGATIESGASCTVKVRFRPTSKRKRSGYLTVTSAKGIVYRKIKLVGTGR